MFCGFSARIVGSGMSFAHRRDSLARFLAVFADTNVRNRRRGTNVAPPVKPGSPSPVPQAIIFSQTALCVLIE